MGEKENLVKLKKFEDNVVWFMKEYPEFKSKYPDMFVAVCNKSIVDSDKDAKELMKRLEINLKDDYDVCAVEFVSTKSYELIL